jgi:hypothetical protein
VAFATRTIGAPAPTPGSRISWPKRTRERAVGVRLALQLAGTFVSAATDLHGVFFEVESPNAAVTSNVRDPGRLRRARIRLYSTVGGVYAITRSALPAAALEP